METSAQQAIALVVAVVVGLRVLHFFHSRKALSQVPGPRPNSWLIGNLKEFFNHDAWDFHLKLYREYGGVARLDMLFGQQQLVVTDPLALYHILVKGQDVYEEPGQVLTMFQLIFGPSLLATLGERHAKQRKMLNPVFSVKHMRILLPMGYTIAHKLNQILENEIASGKEYIDVMNWIGRTTLELIGQAGFGHSFNSLDEDKPTDEYSEALGSLFPAITKTALLRQFLFLAKYGSSSLRRRLAQVVPSKNVKKMIELTDTMERNSKRILEERKKALETGEDVLSGKGADIMSSLMKENVNVPEEELLAHMSTFIFAGHDTTTSAVTQALWVLSQHPEEQSRLREEVTAARRENGDIDYDALMALPYLDAVTRETLRLHSPSSMVARVARKDVVLPVLWPIKSSDGKSELKEIHVPEGTFIFVSTLNANRSKAIWGEDAEEWKPERWLKPLPKSVEDARMPGVYSQMMTFAGGKRACIGFKLAEMELKMLLSTLLEKFVFEPGPAIRWALGPTPLPIVKDTGAEGQLPLKVSFVRG